MLPALSLTHNPDERGVIVGDVAWLELRNRRTNLPLSR